jgi:hypothetical protein
MSLVCANSKVCEPGVELAMNVSTVQKPAMTAEAQAAMSPLLGGPGWDSN